MRFHRIVAVTVTFVALKAPSAQTDPAQPRIDAIFAAWNRRDSPGCAVSASQNGAVLYQKAYGMADLDHDVPLTPDTVFQVGSISKQFTAAAIVLLAEDGKLSLDDDARKYLPELPDFGIRMTIRQLLLHTSGLRDQWALLDWAGWRYPVDLVTNEDVLQLVWKQRALNFKPGDRFLYSNTGYTLLGEIVRRVSGSSLREFTASRIFEPLKMRHTAFRDDHARVTKGQAYGYFRRGTGPYRLSVPNFDTVGATGLVTTVGDLSRWDANFDSGRVGGADLIRQMGRPGTLNSDKPIPYGLGLELGTYRGLAIVEHTGSEAGYRADFLGFPEQHAAVACLCNDASANAAELARQVADNLFAERLSEPTGASHMATDASARSGDLGRFAGVYWDANREWYHRIAFQDRKLVYIARSGATTELRPIGNSEFQLGGMRLRFRVEGARQALEETTSAGDVRHYEAVDSTPAGAARLDGLRGAYWSPELDAIYRLVVDDGTLVLQRPRQTPDNLTRVTANIYHGRTGILRFTFDKRHGVAGFLLSNPELAVRVEFRRERALD